MPILIPIGEGAFIGGEALLAGGEAVAVTETVVAGGGAIEAGADAYGVYRGVKALESAQDLLRAAQAIERLREGSQTEVCSTCEPPDENDPCKDLRKNEGPGDHRGGAHGETIKPANDGKDSHHMPSADAVKQALEGDMARNSVPAIQMSPADHMKTSSWGSSSAANAYREAQADLIRKGRFMEAFENDAANARDIAAKGGEPGKYDQAIEEARKYAKCLSDHGYTLKHREQDDGVDY